MLNKKRFRLIVCSDIMASRGLIRFGTMTVRLGGLSLRTVADMWRSFANTRFWRSLTSKHDYIMVYEPHPNGHGWHIHFLCNFYIPIRQLVIESSRFGFGVCWMECVPSSYVHYVSKYIGKASKIARQQGCKSVRIVNVSRSLVPLRDIDVSSSSIDFIRQYWHTVSGSPKVRWHKLYLSWLYSFAPSLCDFSFD